MHSELTQLLQLHVDASPIAKVPIGNEGAPAIQEASVR